jgi:hypothetical protein
VAAYFGELLMGYDWVVFAEVDELIATRGNLIEDIEATKADAIRVNGYEIVHQPKDEPPLDWDKPILAQRGRWYRSRTFSKVAIGRVPLKWNVGFHGCNVNPEIDPRFTLIHLHRLDLNTAIARCAERQGRPVSKETTHNRWGWQNLLKPNEVKKHWGQWHKPLGPMEPIPAWVRGLI